MKRETTLNGMRTLKKAEQTKKAYKSLLLAIK